MKKLLIVLGIIILSVLAYTNLSSMNARRDYIEACLYISDTDKIKSKCYDVYPESHDRNAVIWGVLSVVGIIVLLVIYNIDNTNKPNLSENDSADSPSDK